VPATTDRRATTIDEGELTPAEALAGRSPDFAARASKWSWWIVAVGMVLRLIRYFANRSLWLDESFLAESLLTYSFKQLATEPLANWQAAPVGFLWLEKLAVVVFGTGEYALRLVPLIAGMISVPLFRALALRCLPTTGALLALTLFATVEPLVYYSSEVKQYGIDVTMTLAVALSASYVSERHDGHWRITRLAIIGGLALFLSHPAVFVLPAVLVEHFGSVYRADPKKRAAFVALAAFWLLLFTLDYGLVLRPLTKHEGLHAYWVSAYMPHDWAAVPWLGQALRGVFSDYGTMWMPLADVAMLAAAGGMIWLLLKDRPVLTLLVLPVAFAIAASAIHRFPFSGRLILFVVPLAILLTGAGVQALLDSLKSSHRFVGAIIVLLIAAPTVGRAAFFAVRPPGREEIKPVLAHIRDHRQANDVIYTLNLTQVPFRYYRDGFGVGLDRFGLRDMRWVVGDRIEATEANFAREFEPLRGTPRLWILMTHFGGPPDEGVVIPAVLDRMGRKLDEFSARGARALLYDLSGAGGPTPATSAATTAPADSPPR
jgi:hypothetical protein